MTFPIIFKKKVVEEKQERKYPQIVDKWRKKHEQELREKENFIHFFPHKKYIINNIFFYFSIHWQNNHFYKLLFTFHTPFNDFKLGYDCIIMIIAIQIHKNGGKQTNNHRPQLF